MVYSQFRTLISLLIVLALAIAFLWGGTRLLDRVTGAAAPPPTPTVQPAIEQPTVAPTPRPRRRVSSVRRRATPVPHPAAARPHPKPRTSGPPPVIMTDTPQSYASPATVFHVGVTQLTCWARNSALPPNATSLTFNWVEDAPLSNHFLYQFPIQRSAGLYSGAYYEYVGQNPGKYHCDVIVNGQVFGTAHFTVLP